MNLEVFIGYVAAILTTISFVPQVFQIHKTKDTSSISTSMYAIFCFGVALWLGYGLIIKSMPVIIANAITLVLATYILIMKLKSIKKT